MSEPFDVFALPLGPLQANCFIVLGAEAGLVVDPGDEPQIVIEAFAEVGVEPAAILVTHGHFDHVGGVAPLARHFGIPVYAGAAEAGEMTGGGIAGMVGFEIEPVKDPILLEGEQTLDLPWAVTAVPTPGHSRGSYTFALDGHLFAGDLLFYGSVGRTDLPGGDMDVLLDSVRTLVRRFPPDTTVHCGHGPDTSLGRELALNPFLSPLRHDPSHHW
jgi:hydroxyacylglutathione hydrolase